MNIEPKSIKRKISNFIVKVVRHRVFLIPLTAQFPGFLVDSNFFIKFPVRKPKFPSILLARTLCKMIIKYFTSYRTFHTFKALGKQWLIK